MVLGKTLESPLGCKEIQPVHWKGGQPWVFFGSNDAKAETPVLWPPHAKSWLIGKDSDAGRDWGQEEEGTTEDEMAGWHHGLNGHECEWTPGVGDGQEGLGCCDSWGRKESDPTERLNWIELKTRPWEFKGTGAINSLKQSLKHFYFGYKEIKWWMETSSRLTNNKWACSSCTPHPVVPNAYTLLSGIPDRATYFSVIYFKDAFYLVPLAVESQFLFSFEDSMQSASQITWKVLPQGFRPAQPSPIWAKFVTDSTKLE